MARILVIDDEVEICKMLQLILEEAGYEVSTANNGESGLTRFCEDSADLIILDIFMPDKDGIDILKELQGSMNEYKIIVISGGGEDRVDTKDVFKAAREFGARYTFSKPFGTKELLAAVKDLLKE